MSTLEAIFAHRSTSQAIVVPENGPKLSYDRLLAQIELLQAQLLANCHLDPGAVVSMALANGVEFAVAFLATAMLRCVSAPLNPNYAEREFKFYLEDSRSAMILVPRGWTREEKPAVRAAQQFKGMVIAEVWWDDAEGIRLAVIGNHGRSGRYKPRAAEPVDTALLLHTSGTTGRPKAVPLTHKNITTTMKNIANTYKLSPEDRTLLVMPLFHVHGLIGGMLSTLLSGGTVVIPPRFSATTFWRDFLDHGCSWYTAVPTIHQILLEHPPPQNGPGRLRFIRSCSSPLAPATLAQLEERFNKPVLEAYAMTEAAHQMTSNPLPPAPRKPGSVGLGQGVQIAILDGEGNPVEEGEVCIKGDNVTLGYLNNPTANASTFTRKGWFRTGDQGRIDENGYLFLTGRIKEIINRGGEKISPLEIDAVLLEHPAVAQAVSFAVPDDFYGQEVHAAVVLREGKHVTQGELQKFCIERIVKFKSPKKIYFTDAIPKTATGKIQRGTLATTFYQSAILETVGKAKL